MANDEQRKVGRRIIGSKRFILQAAHVARVRYREIAREHAALATARAMTSEPTPECLERVGTRSALGKHHTAPFSGLLAGMHSGRAGGPSSTSKRRALTAPITPSTQARLSPPMSL